MENNFFISPTKGQRSHKEIIKDILDYIKLEKEAKYTIVIGTDSHTTKNDGAKTIDFVTAIVIHRAGKGGKYFWKKITKDGIATLRDKIYTETTLSLELAEIFIPEIQALLNSNGTISDVEIHVDVGEFGDTREMIKEVVGMVVGNGYNVKTKPNSYGASSVADRHT